MGWPAASCWGTGGSRNAPAKLQSQCPGGGGGGAQGPGRQAEYVWQKHSNNFAAGQLTLNTASGGCHVRKASRIA